MHFRSFAPIVAFFFATAAMAAPTPANSALVARVDNMSVTVPAKDINDKAESTVADTTATAQVTLQQVIVTASAKITPLVLNLKATVEAKAEVEVEVVVTNLKAIVVELTTLRDELQFYVAHPDSLVAAALSVTGVLAALGPLVQLLFSVLALVLGVVASSPVGVIVTPLIAAIGALVSAILFIILKIAPAVVAGLVPTILGLVPVLRALSLNSIIAIAHLNV